MTLKSYQSVKWAGHVDFVCVANVNYVDTCFVFQCWHNFGLHPLFTLLARLISQSCDSSSRRLPEVETEISEWATKGISVTERDMVVGLSVLEPADLICWDFAAQP